MLGLVQAGVLLVVAGTVVIFFALGRAGDGKTEVRGGGVVMIGPVPIIFGSDAKWASVAIVLAIVLLVVYFLGVL